MTSSPYDQSQAVLFCNYYTHEPNLGVGFDFYLVEATNIDGHDILDDTALCVTQLDEDNPSHTLASCVRQRCDADGDGSIASTDALRVLQFAVGRDVSLLCSACEP